MDIDRRRLLRLAAAAAITARGATGAARAAAPPIGALGLDAAHFGLRPGGSEDQSRALQSAIDAASRARAPLAIAPGIYRAGNLKLPAGAPAKRQIFAEPDRAIDSGTGLAPTAKNGYAWLPKRARLRIPTQLYGPRRTSRFAKLLADQLNGIEHDLKRGIEFMAVRTMDEIFEHVLVQPST